MVSASPTDSASARAYPLVVRLLPGLAARAGGLVPRAHVHRHRLSPLLHLLVLRLHVLQPSLQELDLVILLRQRVALQLRELSLQLLSPLRVLLVLLQLFAQLQAPSHPLIVLLLQLPESVHDVPRVLLVQRLLQPSLIFISIAL